MSKTRIHFMGIGGQGISAIAQMTLDAQGEAVEISGCDMQESATTEALAQRGIAVSIGHSAVHLEGVERLVVVPAVFVLDPQHPELEMARARGIPVITWQEMLGELMRDKCLLAVSGVHGKGTTTAMLSLMLVDAGLDPTCEIGAIVPRFGANYRLGKSEYFVNEADEYYNNFWYYHPRLAIITSIEYEHPEFFADYETYVASFEHFVRGMDSDGEWSLPLTLIVNVGSAGCRDLLARLRDWPGQVITYKVAGASMPQKGVVAAFQVSKRAEIEERVMFEHGTEDGSEAMRLSSGHMQATFEAYDVRLEGETSFRVRARGDGSFPEHRLIRLQLPGEYNVENALAALSASSALGIDANSTIETLEGFSGIRRRFEIRTVGPLSINGRALDVIVVDDYAHHPTAIAATLEAASRRFPVRRLMAVYQPHMFSRTKTFFAQFLTAFERADMTIIADIFPARERDTGLVTAGELVDAMQKRPHYLSGAGLVKYGGSVQATAQLVRDELRSGDLLIVMGAGDIYRLSDLLLGESEGLEDASH